MTAVNTHVTSVTHRRHRHW